MPVKYPLVTHDPNMLKKVTGELIWENKKCLFRREIEKFLLETVTLVHRVCTFPKYCTTNCDAVDATTH